VSARQVGAIAAIAGVCVLAVAVSFTKPFTFGANLLTSVALVVMLIAQVLVEIRRRRVPPVSDTDEPSGGASRGFRRYVWWVAILVAFTALEVFAYTGHPRRDYPTFSSLSDDVSASHVGRAVLFVAWIGLGWLFLSASGRRRRAKPPVVGS
jgi:hypothetical protein